MTESLGTYSSKLHWPFFAAKFYCIFISNLLSNPAPRSLAFTASLGFHFLFNMCFSPLLNSFHFLPVKSHLITQKFRDRYMRSDWQSIHFVILSSIIYQVQMLQKAQKKHRNGSLWKPLSIGKIHSVFLCWCRRVYSLFPAEISVSSQHLCTNLCFSEFY